jgi:signal transduction histidine kinase
MSRVPIRLRVTAAFALAMAAVLAAIAVFVYLRLGSHLSTALDRELRVRAQDLAGLTVSEPFPSSRFIEHGETYAQELTAGGNVVKATAPLGRTPLLNAAQRAAVAQGPIYVDKRRVPGLDEPSRLFATPIGAQGILLVGATTQDRTETLAELRNELLIAGPIALVLASLAGYLLAGLALRPVESMRRRAAAISDETPGERLPVPATGDELQRLGATLNEMLGRLEAGLERERGLVADAGHELRTPLAALRTELELALRHGGTAEDLREAIARSAEEVDRLSQLAEGLLLIARSDRGGLPLQVEAVDVDELFAAVLRRVDWRGKRVTASPSGEVVHGDRIRLEQALVNLVDNALRYGGGAIEVSAHGSELHVTDDGPGFPPEFLDRAFDRFSRADAARGRGGAGLGLAIVRTIAVAHGGSAHAANGPTDVWLALPG